jgi:hypothetical protein
LFIVLFCFRLVVFFLRMIFCNLFIFKIEIIWDFQDSFFKVLITLFLHVSLLQLSFSYKYYNWIGGLDMFLEFKQKCFILDWQTENWLICRDDNVRIRLYFFLNKVLSRKLALHRQLIFQCLFKDASEYFLSLLLFLFDLVTKYTVHGVGDERLEWWWVWR